MSSTLNELALEQMNSSQRSSSSATASALSSSLNRNKSSSNCFLSQIVILSIVIAIGSCFLLPRLTTRFCYNSSDPGRVNSQCVYCNYYLFDSVLLSCTGSSALTVNITATQAFCVISQCLGQIRQSPIFLGRRRRSVEEESEEALDEIGDGDQNEGMAMEMLNRAVRQLQESKQSQSNESNQEVLAKETLLTSNQTDKIENNQEMESTTEIIEFNLDGKLNKYIVKKEVQAVIVDIPEMIDPIDNEEIKNLID